MDQQFLAINTTSKQVSKQPDEEGLKEIRICASGGFGPQADERGMETWRYVGRSSGSSSAGTQVAWQAGEVCHCRTGKHLCLRSFTQKNGSNLVRQRNFAN